MTTRKLETFAMLVVALSGFVWGIFWMPLRGLDAAGIAGVWAIVAFYVLPTFLLTPLFFLRRSHIKAGGLPLQMAGLLAGTSLALYAGALVYTDVVKALLFYYLTPLWSTLLARVVLGEAITRLRWGTICLALLGLMIILRVDRGFDASFNAGDLMGLASGMIWAFAAVSIRSNAEKSSVDYALVHFFWGCVVAFCLLILPLEGNAQAPDIDSFLSVLPWFLPVALILVIPPAFGMMWGATIISPGLLGILFMTEISAGTVTAAIWAGEPFGLREVLGVLLITTAGALEPLMSLRKRHR